MFQKVIHRSVQVWSCRCMLMLEQHAHTWKANVVPVKEGVEAVVNV